MSCSKVTTKTGEGRRTSARLAGKKAPPPPQKRQESPAVKKLLEEHAPKAKRQRCTTDLDTAIFDKMTSALRGVNAIIAAQTDTANRIDYVQVTEHCEKIREDLCHEEMRSYMKTIGRSELVMKDVSNISGMPNWHRICQLDQGMPINLCDVDEILAEVGYFPLLGLIRRQVRMTMISGLYPTHAEAIAYLDPESINDDVEWEAYGPTPLVSALLRSHIDELDDVVSKMRIYTIPKSYCPQASLYCTKAFTILNGYACHVADIVRDLGELASYLMRTYLFRTDTWDDLSKEENWEDWGDLVNSLFEDVAREETKRWKRIIGRCLMKACDIFIKIDEYYMETVPRACENPMLTPSSSTIRDMRRLSARSAAITIDLKNTERHLRRLLWWERDQEHGFKAQEKHALEMDSFIGLSSYIVNHFITLIYPYNAHQDG